MFFCSWFCFDSKFPSFMWMVEDNEPHIFYGSLWENCLWPQWKVYWWFQLLVSSLAKYKWCSFICYCCCRSQKARVLWVLWIDSLDLYKCAVRSNKLVVRKTLRLRLHLGNTMGVAASSCTVWQEVVGHRSGIKNSVKFLYKTASCRLNPIVKCSYNDFKLCRR